MISHSNIQNFRNQQSIDVSLQIQEFYTSKDPAEAHKTLGLARLTFIEYSLCSSGSRCMPRSILKGYSTTEQTCQYCRLNHTEYIENLLIVQFPIIDCLQLYRASAPENGIDCATNYSWEISRDIDGDICLSFRIIRLLLIDLCKLSSFSPHHLSPFNLILIVQLPSFPKPRASTIIKMAPAATMAPKSVENPKADFSPGQTAKDILGKAEFNRTDLHTMMCSLRLGNIKVRPLKVSDEIEKHCC